MQGASKQVSSSQTGVHPRLPALLARHRRSAWRKPPQAVDGPALARLDAALADSQRPLILDSFCGTGMSSTILAQRYPQALVIGVDQSAHRLRRAPPQPRNCLLLQAHCEAVWRHLAERGISLHSHYLLYPNPWPKAGQLARRVHGHPSFPLLLKLGGRLELRSNWQVYPEEFGLALHLLGVCSLIATLPVQNEPLTLFERKYRDSGHDLWVLEARLPGGDSQSSTLHPQGERKEKHHDARN